ncbi:hypothetical protein BDN72DRAFT_962810 [Pluteus cervinus]|uniref:Uncharacterized protein n=1 Tax=Pluteus cervinus TaxID=181527 RepID=A0ACD3AIA5_9AGAR|nr:hypothetical protein BDN72DRAFT_962810 [Pluteus cervinus]
MPWIQLSTLSSVWATWSSRRTSTPSASSVSAPPTSAIDLTSIVQALNEQDHGALNSNLNDAPEPDNGSPFTCRNRVSCLTSLETSPPFAIQTTQTVRVNRDAYNLLMKDIDLLRNQALEALEGLSVDESVRGETLRPLLETLEDVKSFTIETTRRNVFTGMLKKTADLHKIKSFRKKVQQITVQNVDKNVKDVMELLKNPRVAREDVGIGESNTNSPHFGVSGVEAMIPDVVAAAGDAEDPEENPPSQAPRRVGGG